MTDCDCGRPAGTCHYTDCEHKPDAEPFYGTEVHDVCDGSRECKAMTHIEGCFASPGWRETERAMTRVVAEMEQRIADCHHEVPCPRCGAELHVECRSLRNGRPVKHPHRERWTQVVPER